MFDGVYVDIVDVAGEVVFVADCVFPELTLPEPVFASGVGDEGGAARNEGLGEVGFYATPAIAVVGVVFRERE